MLRSALSLTGYRIAAIDGIFGKVKDLLFDDRVWVSRYFVVDSRAWLPGRHVLISPSAMREPRWAEGLIPVHLTKEQVRESPGLEEHLPVSPQYEIALHRHYGWTLHRPETVTMPPLSESRESAGSEGHDSREPESSHLRSLKEVTGYNIAATDVDTGHVEDFVVDDETWRLRYMVVDTRNWLPGRKVLVSLHWIQWIRWGEGKVGVDVHRGLIEKSPKYDPSAAVNRRYEERLFDYYGRPKY